MRSAIVIGMGLAMSAPGFAQPDLALGVSEKLTFHVKQSIGPLAVVGNAAYAGILQAADSPTEWGQGGAGYARRFASSSAGSVIHGALAFGLDSTLREDPRYFRAAGGSFWSRAGHAVRGTILTRTDRGTERLATWRLGSAYGAAYLSNQWYPSRLNTVGLGFAEGSLQLGLDLANNLAAEFWPDIRRKILRRER